MTAILIVAALAALLSEQDQSETPRAERQAPTATGLCVHIRKDLTLIDAKIATSSGESALDEERRISVLGMKTPVPVAWTRDFWAPLWVWPADDSDLEDAGPSRAKPPEVDCTALNLALCGEAECRQAPATARGAKRQASSEPARNSQEPLPGREP